MPRVVEVDSDEFFERGLDSEELRVRRGVDHRRRLFLFRKAREQVSHVRKDGPGLRRLGLAQVHCLPVPGEK